MPRARLSSAAGVLRRLKSLGNRERASHSLRFFRTTPGEYGEDDKFLGLAVPATRRVAREFRDLELNEIAKLLDSEWHQARLVALLILATREDSLELYLAKTHRVNNWDLVDVSALAIVGRHGNRRLLLKLARSTLLWERRIAIVATLYSIRQNRFEDTLRVAELLLGDEHDLIHKACGWMLREVGKRDASVLRAFLEKHGPVMARTMLRRECVRIRRRDCRSAAAGRHPYPRPNLRDDGLTQFIRRCSMHWRVVSLVVSIGFIAAGEAGAQTGGVSHPCSLLTPAQVSAAAGTVGKSAEGDMPGSGRGVIPHQRACSWEIPGGLFVLAVGKVTDPKLSARQILDSVNAMYDLFKGQGWKYEKKDYGSTTCSMVVPPAGTANASPSTYCATVAKGTFLMASASSKGLIPAEKVKALMEAAAARVP
jgi:3-methyladenine DNA glycosylase AlkD